MSPINREGLSLSETNHPGYTDSAVRVALLNTDWYYPRFISSVSYRAASHKNSFLSQYIAGTPTEEEECAFNKARSYLATRLSDINFLREQSFSEVGINDVGYSLFIKKLLHRTQHSLNQRTYGVLILKAMQCLVSPPDFRTPATALYRIDSLSKLSDTESLYLAELSRRAGYEFVTGRPELRRWKEMAVIPE
ncbi:MAG: hypothetical protein M3Q44_07480 [bacterium]|nr:hypothetical protein [bacterium]